MLIMIVLAGGALYTARLSEGAPRVVYTISLEEIEDESGEERGLEDLAGLTIYSGLQIALYTHRSQPDRTSPNEAPPCTPAYLSLRIRAS